MACSMRNGSIRMDTDLISIAQYHRELASNERTGAKEKVHSVGPPQFRGHSVHLVLCRLGMNVQRKRSSKRATRAGA